MTVTSTVDKNVESVDIDKADPFDRIWDGIRKSPVESAYRNKMEYSFGDEYKGGPLSLGMHKKGGFHDIITVDCCTIVDDDYNKIIREVRDFYAEKNVPFYRKMQHVGILRHLVVRRSACSGDILVNIVTTTRDNLCETDDEMDNKWQIESVSRADLSFDRVEKNLTVELYLPELQERLLSLNLHGRIVGILHTWNDSLSDAVVPQKVVTLYGKDHLYEEVLGLKFKISPFSFFQTNSKSAEVLYDTVRSYVMSMSTMRNTNEHNPASGYNKEAGTVDVYNNGDGSGFKDKVIFDLYSGTGTIAQMLAPVAKKVVGIEIVEEAVEAAKENAALNGLTNCDFIAGDVLKVLDTVDEKPDIIVLDPPRDGCNPKALEKIIAYDVPEMVYISCKPTSLARDLVTLQTNGYRVSRACAVDQFPGTLHIECVVALHLVDM